MNIFSAPFSTFFAIFPKLHSNTAVPMARHTSDFVFAFSMSRTRLRSKKTCTPLVGAGIGELVTTSGQPYFRDTTPIFASPGTT